MHARLPTWALTCLSILLLAGCGSEKNRVATFSSTERWYEFDRSHAAEIRALNDGFTPEEREQFYHLAEGSEIFPVKWLMALHSSKTGKPFLEDVERFGLIPDASNPDGLPLGLTQEKSKDLQFASMQLVGVNCAAGHTAQFTYQGKTIRVDGAPGLFDVEGFYKELADSAGETVRNPGKLVKFLDRYGKLEKNPQLVSDLASSECVHTGEFYEVDASDEDEDGEKVFTKGPQGLVRLINQRVSFLKKLTRSQSLGGPGGGFGRTEAFGRLRGVVFGEKEMRPLDAPVSYPSLWGHANTPWLHWDGNTNSALERNIGQAMGLGVTYDDKHNTTTLLIHNVQHLEKIVRKIPAPHWPEELFGKLDPAKLERGRALYAAECAKCHEGALEARLFLLEKMGTDPLRLQGYARELNGRPFPEILHETLLKVKNAAFERSKPPVLEAERASWEPGIVPEWRTTDRYVARSLTGIWATAPFLHNGSVPSLYDLLRPAADRPRTFPVGHREFDPLKVGYAQEVQTPRAVFEVKRPGNSNAGHEFGTQLSESDRLALIEFLKSL